MKFASVLVAFVAASVAAAAPVASFARDAAPSLELRDVDALALNYLVSRGIIQEGELEDLEDVEDLEDRGLFSKLKPKPKPKVVPATATTPAIGKAGVLKASFTDPSGAVSPARQAKALKRLEQAITPANQAKFPFCSVDFGNGGHATFRCFSSAAKKIGQQGPAGAISV
ncbi:hypothetical protein B0H17DRAFT_1135027 [Mycena rosella]|uniref:Uncharacterized protein n=1 Tax=Mycena rosella TaxID=1033263 RepID=A0AAD7GG47_MYCRO|nr:hypothetical protein B0H17DRAFT_1135027 [Mycena rosella]